MFLVIACHAAMPRTKIGRRKTWSRNELKKQPKPQSRNDSARSLGDIRYPCTLEALMESYQRFSRILSKETLLFFSMQRHPPLWCWFIFHHFFGVLYPWCPPVFRHLEHIASAYHGLIFIVVRIMSWACPWPWEDLTQPLHCFFCEHPVACQQKDGWPLFVSKFNGEVLSFMVWFNTLHE